LLFHRIYRVDVLTSLLIALAVILSPYVFGVSFLLLTDSMALLFVVATVVVVVLYLQHGGWQHLAFAALFASCAVLTRQTNIWLFVLIFAAGMIGPASDRRSAVYGTVALLALAAAPFAVLYVAWGGPNPPKWQVQFGLNPGAITFFTASIGAYGAPLGIAALRGARSWDSETRRDLAILAIATVLMLLVGPLQYVTAAEKDLARSVFPTDGYLWRLSRLFPAVAGTSLLFWILVPSGLAVLLRAWKQDGVRSPALLIYLFASATFITNVAIYQKYFDYLALLISFMVIFTQLTPRPVPSRAILAFYCCGFIAYAAANPFR
jgi:DIE2/ALG10 family